MGLRRPWSHSMPIEQRSTKDLRTREPFRSLFPVDSKVLQAIQEDMSLHGYDESQPIIAMPAWWDMDLLVVIDGHTRLRAARREWVESIPVIVKQFSCISDALKYAIHNQRDRRNMTDADIIRCIDVLDKRGKRGGDHGNQHTQPKEAKASCEAKPEQGKSAETTASTLGISRAKVERTRTVLDHADDETKQEVLEGKKSINKAYQETQAKRRVKKERDKEREEELVPRCDDAENTLPGQDSPLPVQQSFDEETKITDSPPTATPRKGIDFLRAQRAVQGLEDITFSKRSSAQEDDIIDQIGEGSAPLFDEEVDKNSKGGNSSICSQNVRFAEIALSYLDKMDNKSHDFKRQIRRILEWAIVQFVVHGPSDRTKAISRLAEFTVSFWTVGKGRRDVLLEVQSYINALLAKEDSAA